MRQKRRWAEGIQTPAPPHAFVIEAFGDRALIAERTAITLIVDRGAEILQRSSRSGNRPSKGAARGTLTEIAGVAAI